ncbi:hypothetical protein E2C01_022263 [Portunus trituberculatus]|uniref:Uncharacterized protein n=1 Tax=Portunus trituberculatus TaxID=210409 RepID=A0A5B7E764_PORTR|nr:hypothetical protein [Portunus trituberculatus]
MERRGSRDPRGTVVGSKTGLVCVTERDKRWIWQHRTFSFGNTAHHHQWPGNYFITRHETSERTGRSTSTSTCPTSSTCSVNG